MRMIPTTGSLFFLLSCYLLLANNVAAQSGPELLTSPETPVLLAKDSTREKVYNVKWKYELPGAVGFVVGSYFLFPALDRSSAFDVSDLAKLNPDDVNGFDRPIIFKDPNGFANAQKHSDFWLNLSIVSPIVLGLDKKVRKDWLDLISLYLVTHAVDNSVYFALAFPIRRARPFTYNPNVKVEDRVGLAKSNSFFSGHVSFAATSTFFLVKVFTDYHEIKGWKRLLLYAAATVPPSLVGYYRMEAARHFKTDVLLGLLVGGSSGILVPELHRNKKKDARLTLEPYYGTQSTGVTMRLALR
ncbi:phosphatase PAP2 family protein [Chitinophaga agrisoli]|uniref:Phosphatase PAP2 family protein n=1 Tax=Chitinophaga agrisoli TaxID=2607653 RepID=A0A5B2VU54_9BACT|nr:phosphatase PAP2 family protein [Chitinophaga agrisoli]KAA2242575.1 phosphatase PAP2 family protein [Chitinophaga agrisoli]